MKTENQKTHIMDINDIEKAIQLYIYVQTGEVIDISDVIINAEYIRGMGLSLRDKKSQLIGLQIVI